MKFSVTAILLAAASLVAAEEFRVVVGKADNGTAAVCALSKKKKTKKSCRGVNSLPLPSLARIHA